MRKWLSEYIEKDITKDREYIYIGSLLDYLAGWFGVQKKSKQKWQGKR